MKQIPLTQGLYTLVDDADYDWLTRWKWFAYRDTSGKFYAVRNSSCKKGKRHLISMSREILGLERGDKREGDHKNHNTLDNCRNNIRICTHQQNMMNQKAPTNASSIFKGVSWDTQKRKWRAQIKINGRTKNLGRFLLEELAALAYDMVAIREHGEFAHLNF